MPKLPSGSYSFLYGRPDRSLSRLGVAFNNCPRLTFGSSNTRLDLLSFTSKQTLNEKLWILSLFPQTCVNYEVASTTRHNVFVGRVPIQECIDHGAPLLATGSIDMLRSNIQL